MAVKKKEKGRLIRRLILSLQFSFVLYQNGLSLLQLALSKGTEGIIRVVSGIRPSMVSYDYIIKIENKQR